VANTQTNSRDADHEMHNIGRIRLSLCDATEYFLTKCLKTQSLCSAALEQIQSTDVCKSSGKNCKMLKKEDKGK